MQRVRVGMTGLASVLILIALASVIFTSANRESPLDAAGAAKRDALANMTDGGSANAAGERANEPLAELGVAPSTVATEEVNASAIARRVEAERVARAGR